MSPSESYQMLKEAYYAPSEMPTAENMRDRRGWLSQNAGLATGVGADVGVAAAGGAGALVAGGLGLAPFTAGVSIPIAIGVGALTAGAGALWDHYSGKRELASQQSQWRGQQHANFMESIRDGSYFDNQNGAPTSMQGLISGTQQYTKTLAHPNFKPPVVNPTPPAQPAAQPTSKEPAPGNLNYTPGMSAPQPSPNYGRAASSDPPGLMVAYPPAK